MEILLKEQLTSCECPYCTKEFVIVGLRNEAKQEEQKQVQEVKQEKSKKVVKSRRSWKASDNTTLKEGLANGLSIMTIAKSLGRSYDVTYIHKQKLGLKGKNSFFWDASDDARMLEMYKHEMKVKDIAKQLGKTVGSVYSRKYILDHKNKVK